jgi:predicted component of type VI protein secretion system
MQIRLKVLKGTKAGKEITLPLPECLIGRGKQCHLRTKNDAISQQHCVIIATPRGVVVRDLQSLNGTFVNGERVTAEVALHGGDQLRIGPLVFEVVIDLPKTERPLPPDLPEVSHGTAGGNANLSTMVVESARRPEMRQLAPTTEGKSAEKSVWPVEPGEPPLLEPGQAILIAGGLLQGATGIVVKRIDGGHYLVSLAGQGGQICARLPAHLLRAT